MNDFSELVGKTLTDIKIVRDDAFADDTIIFTTDAGDVYKMYHCQDCCEHVTIEDICGVINNLIGIPIVMAYMASNRLAGCADAEVTGVTWTFYHIATIKGYVTIRWNGESNGYYSEEVDFIKTT